MHPCFQTIAALRSSCQPTWKSTLPFKNLCVSQRLVSPIHSVSHQKSNNRRLIPASQRCPLWTSRLATRVACAPSFRCNTLYCSFAQKSIRWAAACASLLAVVGEYWFRCTRTEIDWQAARCRLENVCWYFILFSRCICFAYVFF